MKIIIKESNVEFHDGQGSVVCMTTEQLLELVRIVNISFTEEGRPVFETLEFTI